MYKDTKWSFSFDDYTLELYGKEINFPGDTFNAPPWGNSSYLRSLVIKDGAEILGSNTFARAKYESIYLPSSVKEITGMSVYDLVHKSTLTDIYYDGSETQWNNITFGEYSDANINDPEFLERVTIHYLQKDPAIVTHPTDKKAVYGNKTTFTVKADSTNLSYQWQYSTDGKNWKTSCATGNKTETMSVYAAKSNNNISYRCAVTGCGKTVYSKAAKLTSLSAISSQPVNKTAVCGNKATFSVTSRASKATFQWQYSTDGKTWKTSAASGNKTRTITVTASESNNNVKYRCIVKNGTSTEYSTADILTVKANNNVKYRCIVKSGTQTLTSSAATLTTKAK